MKFHLPAALLIIASAGQAFAQPSLSDQIDAMAAVQQRHEAEARAAAQAQQDAIARADAQQRQAAAQQRAAMQLHLRAIESEHRARQAAELAAKKHDEAFTDRAKELYLQERELEVQKERNLVARQNEYIDRDLQQKSADIDVTKSNAEVNRNISTGAKDLMEKTGDAGVKHESGWFH